ncbi:hypothetical protein [Deinococcus soli (ex Cha et al. 2016)]|uniref:Uncharacterized protein n=2 Tax=Deinococcus soli (ex Cha et al. 2016) TaxID=1309411 RepID=A0AAE4BMQ9_9DEIO|nr:hypothetical protein [Deinococcus soli (ex Cha et al. 2016)]MDR6218752.1 hypothetical protein [Deinococcus soli (ex Cha et al. 2016)]MDR6328549.1 hypothetical protein [Deinococcus soli (ex Cha et al. 2016)]MDR6753160.1 hypothetical protein [Deinococcus soli (ex Cha et al. 2016)]
MTRLGAALLRRGAQGDATLSAHRDVNAALAAAQADHDHTGAPRAPLTFTATADPACPHEAHAGRVHYALYVLDLLGARHADDLTSAPGGADVLRAVTLRRTLSAVLDNDGSGGRFDALTLHAARVAARAALRDQYREALAVLDAQAALHHWTMTFEGPWDDAAYRLHADALANALADAGDPT